MGLSYEDRLKRFVPSGLYYRHKISRSARGREPELAILPGLVRRGCVAIDVGANRGIYSYALSRIAARVEAFEPNPDLAAFARAKLPQNVAIHQVALSNRERHGFLQLTADARGNPRHLTATLGETPGDAALAVAVTVSTLDGFGFRDVGFIKIDAEGSEMAIVEGAEQTIRRERPVLLIELLTKRHPDRLEEIERIARSFDYSPWIVVAQERVAAREALAQEPKQYRTLNVLFTPN